MFFNSLTFFRFPRAFAQSFDALESCLEEARLKPVGPSELKSRGFVSPFGRDEPALTHRVGDCIWLTVGGEDKLLPAAVVQLEVAKRIAAEEQKTGVEPARIGGRARKLIKEEVVANLLPRALVKPYRLDAYIDLQRCFIAINTSSRKQAESLVSELRHSLGSFPVLPLNAEVAPRAVLTGWLAGDARAAGLAMGDECELRDPTDNGAVVRISGHDLSGEEEVLTHLEAGKQCTRLSLTLDDHVSFAFGEDLVVRKLRFMDGAVEALENTERDSLAAELDARFALMAGEVRNLFNLLDWVFALRSPEA